MQDQIIHPFNSAEFGELRVVENDGKPLFCGKDICDALGYTNSRKALGDHCRRSDGVTNRYPIIDRLGREQFATFITEGDVYRLIAHSKMPNAVKFESWVFDEVLPEIRTRGGYIVADQNETPEQLMARALKVADAALARKDKQIEVQAQTIDAQFAEIRSLEPRARFADAVGASDGTCLVGEFAKILRQNGVNIGQNRLFEMLRNDGYLGKIGQNHNVPTQRAMELGLFRIKETVIEHSDGHVTINRTPKITGKGQRYFFDRYAGGDAA